MLEQVRPVMPSWDFDAMAALSDPGGDLSRLGRETSWETDQEAGQKGDQKGDQEIASDG